MFWLLWLGSAVDFSRKWFSKSVTGFFCHFIKISYSCFRPQITVAIALAQSSKVIIVLELVDKCCKVLLLHHVHNRLMLVSKPKEKKTEHLTFNIRAIDRKSNLLEKVKCEQTQTVCSLLDSGTISSKLGNVQ